MRPIAAKFLSPPAGRQPETKDLKYKKRKDRKTSFLIS